MGGATLVLLGAVRVARRQAFEPARDHCRPCIHMPGVKRGRGLVGGNVYEALFEDRDAVDHLVDPEERARGVRLLVQYVLGHKHGSTWCGASMCQDVLTKGGGDA